MLDIFVIPLIVAIVGGIILLLFEYRLFQNNKAKSEKDNSIGAVSPLNKSKALSSGWLKVAKDVQVWLEELYCQDQTSGKYTPVVQLERIYQSQIEWVGIDVRKSDRVMEFLIIDKDGSHLKGTVIVQPTGKIIRFFTTPISS